ncbi:hypothetical protein ABW19_dt0208344 [Dactylella cylindrospora]|nr:hypothetical protein ABW19_dt0208344 [Dactylella cylindrospora]
MKYNDRLHEPPLPLPLLLLHYRSSVDSVLDFPQLYTRPPLTALLTTLDLLAIPPPSWDLSSSSSSSYQPKKTTILIRGNPTTWLTSLISSPLKWLPTDASRELIWETASVRLSERCGRTAMPALTREFRIAATEDDDGEVMETVIKIHEPTLDGDNLGLKTWGSSYALAKRFTLPSVRSLVSAALSDDRKVLEIGAGTGLAGLSLAAVGVKAPVTVHLTDLPEIVPNLKRNVELNDEVIPEGVEVTTGVLDWRLHVPGSNAAKYPLIIAADPLYSTEHPQLLSSVVSSWLKQCEQARFIVELPLRKLYGGEVVEFKKLMEDRGLVILEEGEEAGRDDWGGGVEGEVMKCWWAVYAWGENTIRI